MILFGACGACALGARSFAPRSRRKLALASSRVFVFVCAQQAQASYSRCLAPLSCFGAFSVPLAIACFRHGARARSLGYRGPRKAEGRTGFPCVRARSPARLLGRWDLGAWVSRVAVARSELQDAGRAQRAAGSTACCMRDRTEAERQCDGPPPPHLETWKWDEQARTDADCRPIQCISCELCEAGMRRTPLRCWAALLLDLDLECASAQREPRGLRSASCQLGQERDRTARAQHMLNAAE